MYLSGKSQQRVMSMNLRTLQVSLLCDVQMHSMYIITGKIQQGLVNYWLAQSTALHWHLSTSTKVLFVWSRLRHRSHLVAGRLRGQQTLWWLCLQCSLETVPHVVLCLPAARCAKVGFLSMPFYVSVCKVSHKETWKIGQSLVHWGLQVSKGRRGFVPL